MASKEYNMKKGIAAATVLALVSITGCVSTAPGTSQTNTSDAVRDMTVVLAGQCKSNEMAQGVDFKACFNQELDAAVEQIRRFQKCVAPVGCKPNSEQ